MPKKIFKLIWLLTLLVGLSIACETFDTIRRDYDETRGTAGAIATQAQEIITQAQGIATEFSDSQAVGTARALATEYGPTLLETGQALATQADQEGYLQTVEALVTQGSSELLPTFQAVATQFLIPQPPPEDIPIIASGEVSNLFTNQSVVSYYVETDLDQVVEFYQTTMPMQDWVDVSDPDQIADNAAVLKFFKPDRIATITLTDNPISQQTVVLITVRMP
jgi:hypothetical protein